MKLISINRREIFLLSILIIYSALVTYINPNFFSLQTILSTLNSSADTILVALGVLLVMITGDIDISFPATALFGSYVTTKIMIDNGIDNLLFAFILSISFGVLLGLFNGVVVHYLKLPALIITLGTQYFFHGIMTTFIGSDTYGAGVMPDSIIAFSSKEIFTIKLQYGTSGLSYFFIPVAIAVLLITFILYKTKIGRGIFALGNSEESARRVGFNPLFIKLFVYGFLGALAGTMGIVYIADVNAVYPNALIGTELTVIAAVVLGGAKFSGGRGTIKGVLLGVFIINLLNNTLIFLGLSSSWNNLFVGSLLVVSVIITSYQERIENRKNLVFNE